ncbi:hypothetical protein RIF29_31133 [Crotalaria pallida]|uniref:Uncharacterized protein n=1 Tax=Crotalaria pallida TaxID=3830 RepID=A0AAN9EM50_CROPI
MAAENHISCTYCTVELCIDLRLSPNLEKLFMAYTNSNITGTGCAMWFDDLTDIGKLGEQVKIYISVWLLQSQSLTELLSLGFNDRTSASEIVAVAWWF